MTSLATLAPSHAQAQDVDWLTQINDQGFEDTPAGGTIEYLVSVSNNGDDLSPEAELVFEVPAGTTFTGFTPAPTGLQITGCTPLPAAAGVTVSCVVPEIPGAGAGAAVNAGVTLNIETTQADVIFLTVDVPDTNNIDDDDDNNDLTEQTTVIEGSDVEIQMTVPATAAAGSFVDFEIQVANQGPDVSNGFDVVFTKPEGIENITPPAGFTCSEANDVYTCAIPGVVAVGDIETMQFVETLVFTGQVVAGGGSTIAANASAINNDPADYDTTNNLADGDITVTSGTDVTISKTRAPSGTLLEGETVSWNLNPSFTGGPPVGVVVTDDVPANYTVTSVTATPAGLWDCSPTVGNAVECLRTDSSSSGLNVPLGTITINATVDTAGEPENVATVAIDEVNGPIDQNPSNNTDDDGGAVIEEPEIDLQARKFGPNPRQVVVGQTYSYSIRTRNRGNADTVGTITMTDTLPAGMTIISYNNRGWTCSPAAPVVGPTPLVCTQEFTDANPLEPNRQTDAVSMRVRVDSVGDDDNMLSNTLVVGSDSPIGDSDLGNNTTIYTVGVQNPAQSAALSTAKSADPVPQADPLDNIFAGDIQTFDLEIINAGPANSLDVDIADTFNNLMNSSVGPTGAGYIGFTPFLGTADAINCDPPSGSGNSVALTCNIPVLAPCVAGDTCPVITVQVRPGGDGGTYTNTFSALSQGTPDPDLSDNTAEADYAIRSLVDVTVSKGSNPETEVSAGQDLEFTITATNVANGLSTAANVRTVDTLPDNLTYISATPSTGSCSVEPAAGSVTGPGNNTVECNLGAINNGSQQIVRILTRPNNLTRNTVLTNNVVVSTSTDETDVEPNTAIDTVTVNNPELDLRVNKTDFVDGENYDPVAVGDTALYLITVDNRGPSASENLIVTDVMPTGLIDFQSVTPSAGGNCTTEPAVGDIGGLVICEWEYVPARSSVTMLIEANGRQKGSISNNVSINSDEINEDPALNFDTQPANNATFEETTVRTRTDIEVVSKTAVPGTVNLLENFDFEVLLRVNTGGILEEAEGVTFTDEFPSNLELTGAPTAVVTVGSTTENSCSGVAGDGVVTCEFGDVSSGAEILITLPVEVTSVMADPATITNSASVATTSRDIDEDNNTNSGDVIVASSSISGNVFRDFGDDGTFAGGDTGVEGVLMTLEGTTFDGRMVTLTTTTGPNGEYSFDNLAQGEYTVTRGDPNEGLLIGGQIVPNGGFDEEVDTGAIQIASIDLGPDQDSPENNFALVPQASIGIAKAASEAVVNADGSYTTTFSFVVENLSIEPLINVAVTDQLSGGAPLFGNQVTLANPATDTMALGTYTILTPASGSCGGFDAGFNGDGNTTVANGIALPIDGTCDVSFAIRVLPAAGRQFDTFENQAIVTGEGELSGQTSDTNPALRDLSDDGTTPDANDNREANDDGEDTPTPVVPGIDPSIAVTKAANISEFSDPVQQGDTLNYTFNVRNTGNVTLTNISISDVLPDIVMVDNLILSLAPGETSDQISATYELKLTDLNNSFVDNLATVSGTDPFGETQTDQSGIDFTEDETLRTPLAQSPDVRLLKSADTSALQSPPQDGDIITYNFTVINVGNVTLTNLDVSDMLFGLDLQGDPIASLDPGERDEDTFFAEYAITLDDLEAGTISNTANVGATPPTSDTSGTTVADDDPTVVTLDQQPSITIDKMSDNSNLLDGAVEGELITYSFTVTNTGNLRLYDITIDDLLDGVVQDGGPIDLDPGEFDTDTFTAEYAITQDDIDNAEVVNTAIVTGFTSRVDGDPVDDRDVETTPSGNVEANPEVYPNFNGDGGETTSVLGSDTINGDPATLDNVFITVLDQPDGLTLDPDTGIITIAPNTPAGTYEIDYQITSQDVPTLFDDTTETIIIEASPRIEAVKLAEIADTNGDGRDSIGDIISYTILVANTGNVPLTGVTIDDTLTDLDGGPLELDADPEFQSATLGSLEGELQYGEIATYTAQFTVNLQAVNAFGVSNTVLAEGTGVHGDGVPGTPAIVTDSSDAENDNVDEDAPTVTPLDPSGDIAGQIDGLTMTKTTPASIVTRGGLVPYTITVTNVNDFAVGPVDLVDTLPDGFVYEGGSAFLDGIVADVTVVAGTVVWDDVIIPAQGQVVATLTARILSGTLPGDHRNTADLFDPATGDRVTPQANADVVILPEGVFDCGDVVGRVFEDHNGNGYQDAPENLDALTITDQTYYGGKGKLAPSQEELIERGLPGVRLATVDGTVITTDENGLFSVPCAALPDTSGSNFILKLDERTLPAGFRMTTENPRVARLSRGMMSEMNFGAAIGRVVRVDINANAFVQTENGPALSAALQNGLVRVLQETAGDPATIRIGFQVAANATASQVSAARVRMDLTEDYIKEQWRNIGRVQLRVEQIIVRAGQ